MVCTVWEFMHKMGDYEKFRIVLNKQDITGDELVSRDDVNRYHEERKEVLDVLERSVTKFDLEQQIIFCE